MRAASGMHSLQPTWHVSCTARNYRTTADVVVGLLCKKILQIVILLPKLARMKGGPV